MKTLIKQAEEIKINSDYTDKNKSINILKHLEQLKEMELYEQAETLLDKFEQNIKLARIKELGYKCIPKKRSDSFIFKKNLRYKIMYFLFGVSLITIGICLMKWGLSLDDLGISILSMIGAMLIGFFGMAFSCYSLSTNPEFQEYSYKITNIKDYKQPIPLNILKSYQQAKQRNLFDNIIVVGLKKDPLLIGLMDFSNDWYFIDQWDNDLRIEDIMKGEYNA